MNSGMGASLALTSSRVLQAKECVLAHGWQEESVADLAAMVPQCDKEQLCFYEKYAKECTYIDWEREHVALLGYVITEEHLAMGMVFHRLWRRADKTAIIAFRGSVLDRSSAGAGASLVGDLDPFGVGWSLFWLGYGALQHKLEALHREGYKVTVIGHSLGGALAAYVGIYFNALVDKVYTFAAPGVSWFAARKWRLLDKKAQEKINNYWHRDDPVSRLGHEAVGIDYKVIESAELLSQDQGNWFARSWNIHIRSWLVHDKHTIESAPRVMSGWRYFWPFITLIPWLIITIICALKIRILGTKSHHRATYLLGLLMLLAEYLKDLFRAIVVAFTKTPAHQGSA